MLCKQYALQTVYFAKYVLLSGIILTVCATGRYLLTEKRYACLTSPAATAVLSKDRSMDDTSPMCFIASASARACAHFRYNHRNHDSLLAYVGNLAWQ